MARHKKSNELTHDPLKQVDSNISLFIQMDKNECHSGLLDINIKY